MTITRINKFQAHEEQAQALRDLLESFVPMIRGSDGCLDCQVLQNLDDPALIVVIEIWESVESHQASVKNILSDALKEAMTLIAGPPESAYYSQ
jgi:quinol monooxygenase YgiN